MPEPASFDQYAESYHQGLNQGLAWSGEDANYYGRGRLTHLAACLAEKDRHPRVVLDYGCGVGGSVPLIREILAPSLVIGVDPSLRSIQLARLNHGGERTSFHTLGTGLPPGSVDLAYTTGVFHHIPPDQRHQALTYIHHALRPGGLLALGENNPLNPGTRYLMRHLEIDRDAVPLTHWEASRRLVRSGFKIVRLDFLFFFIRPLAFLRPLEPFLRRLPLGAQYLVLARRR